MGRFVLIGGGQNGYHKECYETGPIDRAIVEMAGRKNPHFLFIGLANGNPDGYCGAMRRTFGKQYGCRMEYLSKQLLEAGAWEKIDKLLAWADIIYAAGGNTLKQMKLFRKYGLDARLRAACENGNQIFCGVSAGAICWCRYGGSDSLHYQKEPEKLTKLRGLDLAPVLFCPHITTESYRIHALKKLMQNVHDVPALACDYAAIAIDGEEVRVLGLQDAREDAICLRRGKTKEGKLEVLEEKLVPGRVYRLSELAR